jgi:hypothetical protein
MAFLVVACTSVGQMARVPSVDACTIPRLARQPSVPMTMADAMRAPSISDDEARIAGDCVEGTRRAAFVDSDHVAAREHAAWRRMTTRPYRSEHAFRGIYVEIFADARAAGYAQFEDGVPLPVGARIAKASFLISHEGLVSPGPLFLLEKMPPGFDPEGGDWRYTLVGPDGKVVGETGGHNASGVRYCFNCHKAGRNQDFLLFPAPPYRRPAS